MYCPQCGAHAKEGARFCAQCGTPLATSPRFPRPTPPQTAPATPGATTSTAREPEADASAPVAPMPDATPVAVQEPAAGTPDAATAAREPITDMTPDNAATAVQEPVPAAAPQPEAGPETAATASDQTPADAQASAQDDGAAPVMPTMPIPNGQPNQMPTTPIPNARQWQSPFGPGAPVDGGLQTGQSAPAPAQATVPTGQVPPVQTAQGPAPTGPIPPVQGPASPMQPGVQPGAMPGAQPGLHPGMNVSPTMQAIRNNATVREMTAPHVLKTAGVSLGIGLASALVLAVVATVVLTAGGAAALDRTAASSGMGGVFGGFGGILTGPNFFQILVFALIAGVSGSFSLNMSANGVSLNSMASASLSLPVGLSGAALAVGAAFGAYLFARRLGVRFKWTGVASAVGVGVASGLVYVLLGAIFPIAVSASYGGEGAGVSLNGASFRTFAMAFALAGLGALTGYFLAQFAPDSSNVFLAAWRWTHRTRGFVRTAVESAAIYTAVFTVAALVTLVVAAVMTESAAPLTLIPFAFPFLPVAEFALGALGAVSVTVTGRQTTNLSVFTPNLGDSLWAFVLLIVVFVVTTLYIALRLSARNIYDRAYADWRHSWKSPVVAAVAWVLVTFCVADITVNISALQGATGGSVSVAPAMWFFVVAALWAFLVEVVALTFGPTLVMAMPGLWRLFVGGTVRPTPQSVTDYVIACGAVFGRPAGPQAPAGQSGMGEGGAMPPAGNAAAAATAPTAPTPNDAGTAPADASGSTSTPSDADNGAANGVAPAATRTTTPGDDAPTTAIPVAIVPPTAAAPATPVSATPANPTGPATPTAPMFAPAGGRPGAPASSGYATAAAIPPTVPAAPAPRKPMTAKQKMALVIVGVVAAVAIALGIAYAVLNATLFSPSHVADEYLSAIAGGEYDRANGIADPQIDQDQRALLTDAAAQAENATISNARVVSVTDAADGSKTVAVTYTIGGNTVNDSFTMASTGSRFLVFPDWTVTTPMLKQIDVTVSSAVTELEINGVAVNADNAASADGYSMSFRVYPGTYRIAAAESDYFTSDTLTLDTNMSTSGSLSVEPTDTLTDEIQSAVDEKLRTCAASTDAEPEGCPFGRYVYSSDRYRNFSWSVTESPTVDYVSLDGGTFSTGLGEAQATYEYQNYDETWEPDDYTDTFYVNGDFIIDGDGVTVTFDEDYW